MPELTTIDPHTQRILGALDIPTEDDGWADVAVEMIERLRDIEDAVLAYFKATPGDDAHDAYVALGEASGLTHLM